jgi:hypothetical protein
MTNAHFFLLYKAESFYADLKMEPDITFENDPVDTSLKEHVSSASTFDLC